MSYDPGEHTVDEVVAYVDAHPDEADAVLAAEQAGKNRVTLVNQLEAEPETVQAAASGPPGVSPLVTTTNTKDHMGRALVDIATTAKDYNGRLILSGALDYMGRATVA